MRVVAHGRDAGVDAHQHRHERPGVHVLGTIGKGHGLVHHRVVAVRRVAWRRADLIGHDARDLTLPRVDVRVAESRDEDHVLRIDHDGLSALRRRAQVRSDGGDLLALDEHVALREVAHRPVHADDRPALEQDPPIAVRIGTRETIERSGVITRLGGCRLARQQRHDRADRRRRRSPLEELAS